MTIELYKPYQHQKVVHDAISNHIEKEERFTANFQKIFVVKACRQVGKTALSINELLRFCFQFKNSKNGYVAPTLKFARVIYEDIKKIVKDSGLLYKYNSLDLIIELTNGSVIRFFSGEQRDNLRGYTITGILVIDEAAFIRDDIYQECISPWCDAKNAITLIISTPKFKFGFFYNLYILGMSGNNKVLSFDFTQHDLTCIRSEEILEQKRLLMPKQAFRSEYLGMFIDADGSVFGDFSEIILKKEVEYTELYLGLDFGSGSGKDYTVLTAFNELGEQVFIWRTNDMTPTEQVGKIIKITDKIKDYIFGFYCELNGIGKIYFDMIKNKYKNITPFITTNQSKRKIVEQFQTAIEQKKVKLINDAIQLTEFTIFELSVNKVTNTVTYAAPSGMHDDHVMSTLIAYECYNKKKNNKYHFSII